MIPKIIHCCWVGGGEKDKLSAMCRKSWAKYAPGFEVHEWTKESLKRAFGFGALTAPAFVTEAIERRKWAFVADWVRFAALYLEGGVYFDYDFELVKPIDPLLVEGPFVAGQWMPDGSVGMEPAILALEKGSPIAKAMLERYATVDFDGITTVGTILADVLAEKGLSLRVLPPEVLSPIDVQGVCHRTEVTVGIHHYAMSWAPLGRRFAKFLSWHGLRPLVSLLLKAKRPLR